MDSVSRLRWRCRRGMRELDVMLSRFLEGGYQRLDQEARERFAALLEREDDQLWDWLSGRVEPEEQGIAAIVEQIRRCDRPA